jgi:hypothetical protein
MAALWRAQVSGGAAIWAPVNGPGTPSTPTVGTITPTADGCVFTHSGGGTHYRIFALAGSPGAWVSLPASPVTVTGLTANTEYTLQLSADASTVADAADWGTLNPGVGGGGVVPDLVVQRATHGHTADNITLSTGTTLAVQDSTHDHAADSPSLSVSGETSLTVASSTHSHAADSVSLEGLSSTTLAVQDAQHAHTADRPTLDPGVVPGAVTVTIRLVDAAVSGAPLPDLGAIQWAWWDDAADESETWGVMPTASGTTASTDGGGSISVGAVSTKNSGQAVFLKFYKHSMPPRALSGLFTVD